MIIDADCHISPTPEGGNSISTDELLRRMDRCGVDRAIVWLQPPYVRTNLPAANRYVYEATKAHPDRILGFGWADPHLGVQASIDEAKRCLEQYGLYGVKLNGAQNSYLIDDPAFAMPIAAAIVEAGGRLAYHIGGDSPEFTHPFRLGKIAQTFPDTTIFGIHMGGAAFHDLSRAFIEVAKANENIVGIASGLRASSIANALRSLGTDRVCFGSDTPFSLMHADLAMMRAILEDFSPAESANVLGLNAARALDLA